MRPLFQLALVAAVLVPLVACIETTKGPDRPPDTASDEDETTPTVDVCANPDPTRHIDAVGEGIPQLDGFEQAIRAYMIEHAIPNGAIALMAGDGRLVLDKALTNQCGEPFREQIQPATRDSLFRIASVTKILTAATLYAMEVRGEHGLSTTQTLGDHLPLESLADPDGDGVVDPMDPRIPDITLAELIRHQTGWDCDKETGVGDATKQDWQILDAYARVDEDDDPDVTLPLSTGDVQGYLLGLPLAWDPGTTVSYCNHGYLLLGRIIEARTGVDFGVAVDTLLFGKAQFDPGTLALGATREAEARPGEVHYVHDTTTVRDSVVAPGEEATLPYGGAFNLEVRWANGGYTGTAADVVRFGHHLVTGQLGVHPDIVFQGIGTRANRSGARGHTGSLEGTHAILLCHGPNDANPALADACWTFLFNKSPPDAPTKDDPEPRTILADTLANQVLDAVVDLGTDDYGRW